MTVQQATFTTPRTGLTKQQVASRTKQGHVNVAVRKTGRRTVDIIRSNVFTRINAILGVLLIIVIATGSLINAAFGLLIVANSAIGIIQEIRAKKTLDKLTILAESKIRVIRDGRVDQIERDEIVIDDLIDIGPGDQLVVDGFVTDADGLRIDESLLTGESDSIVKNPGDPLLSGSFVKAGSGSYQATAIGSDAYSAKLIAEAGRFTLTGSQLQEGINKILSYITWLLIPTGVLTIWSQLSRSGAPLKEAVLSMVAALVPMVPEGLVLMTSIAFAVGVVRLGKHQALINELPAIEGLARVDTVCADKTGTLTENTMVVDRIVSVADPHQAPVALVGPGTTELPVAEIIAAMVLADSHPNDTMQAIAAFTHSWVDSPGLVVGETKEQAPFDSSLKWSGISTGLAGSWVLGAPDVLLRRDDEVAAIAEEIGAQGLRVLVVGFVPDGLAALRETPGDAACDLVSPQALVVLAQKVRDDAEATLDFFAREGVETKIISGDNARSVAAVARSVGFGKPLRRVELSNSPAPHVVPPAHDFDHGAVTAQSQAGRSRGTKTSSEYIQHCADNLGAAEDIAALDARDLPAASDPRFADLVERHCVFGRVTPQQKRDMVLALQERGKQVAMTGDGVNDVLALKEANIGVSMGSGSPATRSVAQVVLLDNSFATLPLVVAEGRRVIGNIERVANLFLTKTIYSVVLALVIGVLGMSFPFQPIHVTMAGWFTIGIPAFVLSLAPNHDQAKPGFVSRVLRLSLPAGITIGVLTVVFWVMHNPGEGVNPLLERQAATATLSVMLVMAVWVVAVVARPYRPWKIGLILVSIAAYVSIFITPWTAKVLLLDPSNMPLMWQALLFGGFGAIIIEASWWIGARRWGRPAVWDRAAG
ncbi:HAD-IC family P-type ATPase [Corynebacterium choanae]|nr:HAD-IC family P-type ATPase [Corynebacterium choanae]